MSTHTAATASRSTDPASELAAGRRGEVTGCRAGLCGAAAIDAWRGWLAVVMMAAMSTARVASTVP
jgi:hypothetical protein